MDERWRERAACLGRTTSTFDPWSPPDKVYRAPNLAREVCERCPVRKECLIAGINGDEWGVWGGLTRRERTALKRPRNRVRCPICAGKLITESGDRLDVCVSCGISWRRHRTQQS